MAQGLGCRVLPSCSALDSNLLTEAIKYETAVPYDTLAATETGESKESNEDEVHRQNRHSSVQLFAIALIYLGWLTVAFVPECLALCPAVQAYWLWLENHLK